MRSPEDTAYVLAALVIESKVTRARISCMRLMSIAQRTEIRAEFIVQLKAHMDMLGFGFFELASGLLYINSFGIVVLRALEGAQPLTCDVDSFNLEQAKSIVTNWVVAKYLPNDVQVLSDKK